MIRGSTGDIGEGRKSSVPSSQLGEMLDEINTTAPQIMVRVEEMASRFSHPSYYWDEGPIILTERGTLLWALHYNVCVEMTTDEAFRITDFNNNIVIAVNPTKDSCLLLGNSGAIFTTKNDVEVTAYEQRNKNDKMLEVGRTAAVMYGVGTRAWLPGVVFMATGRGAVPVPCQTFILREVGAATAPEYSKFNVKEKEIIFSSRESKIAYTVNEGGVGSRGKTCFNPIYQDFSYDILNHHGNIGKKYEVDAVDICSRAKYAFTPQCTQLWRLKGVRISYSYNCELHPHLYLKKDGLRLFYDGLNYINRSGSQAAGFDRLGMMRVFSPVQQHFSVVHF